MVSNLKARSHQTPMTRSSRKPAAPFSRTLLKKTPAEVQPRFFVFSYLPTRNIHPSASAFNFPSGLQRCVHPQTREPVGLASSYRRRPAGGFCREGSATLSTLLGTTLAAMNTAGQYVCQAHLSTVFSEDSSSGMLFCPALCFGSLESRIVALPGLESLI